MAGFRNSFIHGFGFLSNLWSTKQLIGLSKTNLLLPVYHTISDQQLPHISGLYKVKDSTSFEQDLDFLLKHFQPIQLDQLIDHSNGINQIKKPSFLLTFDDGLSQFHDIIAPILEQKGVPAICFLNSAFIDNKALFYRYKASLLINHLQQDPTKIIELKSELKGSSNFKEYLLSIPYKDQRILDQIANKLDIDFEKYLKENQPYLNAEHINSLIKKGIHFGAHSIDHPEYQYLDVSEQMRQTNESINFVCKKFEIKDRLFAFPFTDYGVGNDFFEQANRQDIFDISFGSAGLKREAMSSHLQRVPLEMENLTAQDILKAEMLYAVLRNFLGKDKIVR